MPIFPIASSKSLADARIVCVFFLALEKIFGANCKGYLRTLPKFTAGGECIIISVSDKNTGSYIAGKVMIVQVLDQLKTEG